MRIIGHRGASSLALENSLESIRAGVEAGVDAVEFDIRLSSDHQFVLSHDPHLTRVSPSNLHIRHSHSDELNEVRLHNGEKLPTLTQALEARGDKKAFIEAKGNNWAEPLAKYLKQHKPKKIAVIAFNHSELCKFHDLMPKVKCYPIERTKALETMQLARHQGLAGVDLNFWLLNPFTYWYARYYKLDILVYTVNYRLIAWYFRAFFPHISITTDTPQHFKHLKRS